MKNRKFYTFKDAKYNGKRYIVAVYGELSETKEHDGICICKVKTNRSGREINSVDTENGNIILCDEKTRSRLKTFNMGHAICAPEDVYSEDVAIKLCKKRFAKSPITTRNGNFLTIDMVTAIIENEVDYICEHINKFVKSA